MTVRLGGIEIGSTSSCYVIAEIGINHNGDLDLAKRLIKQAADAGCDAVKFQKRTVEKCVPEDQKNLIRETPWGTMTYLEYRYRVEFDYQQYEEIARECSSLGIEWFASCWDEDAVDFIQQFNPPCYKIASASLTDDDLLIKTRNTGVPVILSTGMSTLEEIDHAVSILGSDDLILMHTCSAYPAHYEELNLRTMSTLRDRYQVPVGYSGHETGIATTVAAYAMGASVVERHITTDRSLWGSDQAASLESSGLSRLVRDIRLVETALGDGVKRVYERELPVKAKLRRK
jgi:N-acetylneuraminate synthase